MPELPDDTRGLPAHDALQAGGACLRTAGPTKRLVKITSLRIAVCEAKAWEQMRNGPKLVGEAPLSPDGMARLVWKNGRVTCSLKEFQTPLEEDTGKFLSAAPP